VVCDVGQGDAIVLRAGPAAAVVVDTGPDPVRVDRCLRRLGVRQVPLLVLTHFHADHVLGLPGVLRHRAVGRVLVGPLDEPVEQGTWVREVLRRARIPVTAAAPGTEWTLGPLRWRVLGPLRPFHGTASDPNNSSVVLRVRTRGVTALLTGDVEPVAQRALLAAGEPLAADVLKVAHHGSAAQDRAFLAAVRPRVAVTSVGADNDYGHPAPELLAELRGLGALGLRTDRQGDVALVVRDRQLRAVPRGTGSGR
jgi:competence protein ComEC